MPLATEAMRRAAFGKRRTAEEELEAQQRVLDNAKKTAEAMLKTLGEMKGLPLKLGQMASYIDGLAPPGYEEKFQDALKKLQAKAPPLSPEAATKVVTKELGPPEEIFAEWEREPFAAASIGQVHRASTKAGDRVAVKVQYPGIDKAIENDLKSISLLEPMMAPVGRKYHTKEALDEIKPVFLAELDYGPRPRWPTRSARCTAATTRSSSRACSTRTRRAACSRSSTSAASDYATSASSATQEERNAASATIWRFMFRSLFGTACSTPTRTRATTASSAAGASRSSISAA